MKDEIVEHIEQLEKEQGITILLAVESGSRAWGCPSPDSDFDVRIIFKRPLSQYLEIHDKPDTINYFHGKLLDINGWDLKKTLKLILKSNATPFEWAQSPIVYKDTNNFKSNIIELSKRYFQPRHTLNHYKGIAKNSYLSNNLNKEIKLKKLFYVLRPLMAAKWIIDKNEIPPMDIPPLLSIIDDQAVVNHIRELLVIKNSVNEDYIHVTESIITDFIEEEFKKIEGVQLEDQKEKEPIDMLNKYFIDLIEN